MNRERRSGLAAGLALILLGVLFLVVRLVPGLEALFSWPWAIVGVGMFLLVLGLLTRVPALAIPASIVGGIGGLLVYQNASGHWESWAYAWTLIPGFVGVGIVLAGILGGGARRAVSEGGTLILISLVMFAIAGSFFGALGMVGPYWPVLLIVLGVLALMRAFFRFR